QLRSDLYISPNLLSCSTHSINKNAGKLTVKPAGDKFGLPILVFGSINTITGLPRTIIFITDLPVSCPAVIITDTIGGITSRCRYRVFASAISFIGKINSYYAVAILFFQQFVVVIKRHRPACLILSIPVAFGFS